MKQSGAKTDDFAHGRVPEKARTSGWHLAMIIIGGTIGFAIFIVASQIGGSLGYVRASAAFALGSLVLGGLGALTSYVGARSRYSTYLLTEFAFGAKGARIANLAVALSLVGWYGVISNFLGVAAQDMLLQATGVEISSYVSVLIASSLMIGVTAAGFTGIDKLAKALVPVMVFFLFFAALRALMTGSHGESALNSSAFTFQTAVSAVIGSYIVGVVIQPDYSRFAVNTKHAIWSVFIALGLVFPVIQFLSAVPSMALNQPDIMQAMQLLGVLLPAFFLLVLGAWSSNVLCLYSAGLSTATFFVKARLRHIIVVLGIMGTAVAFIPAQSFLVSFLVLLGVAIPPIGAIYCLEAMLLRRFRLDVAKISEEAAIRWRAFFAWGGAIAAGYASHYGYFGFFHIASIDSLIVSTVLYGLLHFREIHRGSVVPRCESSPPPK